MNSFACRLNLWLHVNKNVQVLNKDIDLPFVPSEKQYISLDNLVCEIHAVNWKVDEGRFVLGLESHVDGANPEPFVANLSACGWRK